MEISALDISPTIRFSNTGARGLKFFDISKAHMNVEKGNEGDHFFQRPNPT